MGMVGQGKDMVYQGMDTVGQRMDTVGQGRGRDVEYQAAV